MRPTVRIIRRGRGIDKLKPPKPGEVAVGFPSGETDSDIIMKAIWNEFGTRGGRSGGGWGGPIPERPFLRNALRSNRDKYRAAMRKAAKALLAGDAKTLVVLRKLGLMAMNDVKAEITSMTSPPNSDATIKLKGSSKPLSDTGEMRNSVTYKVQK
jgi:hypothetical protein